LLPDDAYKIVSARQRLVEIPGHVTCGWDGAVAAIAMPEFPVCQTALRPCAPEPVKVGNAGRGGGPAPVGLGLHLYVEWELPGRKKFARNRDFLQQRTIGTARYVDVLGFDRLLYRPESRSKRTYARGSIFPALGLEVAWASLSPLSRVS
jgi:hypothetical protein